jgi:hypothetical protein
MSSREKILCSITLVLILCALLYNLVLQDIFVRWNQLAHEIDAKERLLKKQMGLLQEADRINSDYAKLSTLANAPSNESVTVSQTLKRIQVLAKNEIELENIRPLETKTLASGSIYEFELEGRAAKGKLIRFLYKVITSGEALRIRALTLSSTRSGEGLRYYMVISKIQIS